MSTLASTAAINLPRADRSIRPHTLGRPGVFTRPQAPLASRVFFAAAHVVADALREPDGSGRARLDWDATLAFRRHLWSYGLGVAEAMDTAQRSAGLDWSAARELIRRSTAEARSLSGAIACGAGTDQLEPAGATLAEVREAYLEQCGFVEGEGAQIILMASRALTIAARSADDYLELYGSVLEQSGGRVILHWLGELFDPQLVGYWGSRDISEAMDTVVTLIEQHASQIDGIKISLLDAGREVELRRRLPAGVRLYTGDDLDYPTLIRGDGTHASDALLGIFDAIAPAASTALQALDSGDVERFDAVLAPTVPLSRQIFSAPTFAYKTGVVLLAWLNGHQPSFRMLRGAESARSLVHLSETFVLADRAGLLADPELATARMRDLLRVAGIDA
jgi:hypothetical protein